MTYSWTDNPTKVNVASCDPDVLNDCLMHLKYNNTYPQEGKVVYSVNSAKRNASGYGLFMYKIDNDTVGFRVDDGTSHEPLVITFPNGITYPVTSVSNETISSSNTTYEIVIRESDLTSNGDGTYSCSGVVSVARDFTEGYIFPSSPLTNDYHLDISIKPYKGYRYTGSEWAETEYVKLGQVTRTSDTLGEPLEYAFNGYYDSGWFAVSTDSAYSINDNLGINEKDITVWANSGGTEDEIRAEVTVDSFTESVARGSGCIVETDNTKTNVYTGDWRITTGRDDLYASGALDLTSGYYKVIAKRTF